MPAVPPPNKIGPVSAILWTHMKVADFDNQVQLVPVSMPQIPPSQILQRRPRRYPAV